MPSAAKQRIPSDLWHPSHGRYSPGHCGSMQASPVQSEVFQDDLKQHSRLTPKKAQNFQKNQRRQRTTSAKGGSTTPLPMRGSSDDLRVATVTIKDTSKSKTVDKVPCTSDSSVCQLLDAGTDTDDSKQSSTVGSDAFAMDTALPPHPSELPLPPMEWLKVTSQSPLTVGRSLHTILMCQVAA